MKRIPEALGRILRRVKRTDKLTEKLSARAHEIPEDKQIPAFRFAIVEALVMSELNIQDYLEILRILEERQSERI